MIIQIRSNNPDFLSLVEKNPTSNKGYLFRKMRDGVAVSKIEDNQTLKLVFIDHGTSFREEGTQLDTLAMARPRVALALMSEFLSHFFVRADRYLLHEIPWLKKSRRQVDSDQFDHQIECDLLVNSTWMREGKFLLERYLPGLSIINRAGNCYSIILKHKGALLYAVSLFTCILLLTEMSNKEDDFYHTDELSKYIRVFGNLHDIPYFVVYLFKKQVLRSEKNLEENLKLLEGACSENVKLSPYDTNTARRQFVRNNIDKTSGTVDFGCGEMNYKRALAKIRKEYGTAYLGIDKEDFHFKLGDHVMEGFITGAGSPKNIWQNISFKEAFLQLDIEKDLIVEGFIHPDLYSFITQSDGMNALLIEVIEHLSDRGVALQVVRNILKHPFERLILSTPNRLFNIYYQLENKHRRDDHMFELTSNEFVDFCQEVLQTLPQWEVKIEGLGDSVNDQHPTMGAIFTRKP